jgi:hypothetical protein
MIPLILSRVLDEKHSQHKQSAFLSPNMYSL